MTELDAVRAQVVRVTHHIDHKQWEGVACAVRLENTHGWLITAMKLEVFHQSATRGSSPEVCRASARLTLA